jgi:Golgi phosphoprotein 3 (GPP34)
VRSFASWISKLSKASRDAYDDHLVAQSLARPAMTARDGPVASEEAVQAVRDRIRGVLAHSHAVEPRDVALVILLAHTDQLTILLDDPEWTELGPIQAAKAARRDERLGRDAADVYGDLADFGAIVRIATEAAPDGGG